MSHDAPGPRPRQVTVGAWVVAVASALLVVTVFDATTHLHSVETRDAVTDALTSGSAKGLGLSVDDAIAIIRWALLVAGVAAATTAVLGVFVLQRHTAARVVLTVAAVPIALSAPIGGSGRSDAATAVFLLGILVAGGTALLWTEPARDWFAGRAPTTAQRTPSGPAPKPVPKPAPRPAPAVSPPATQVSWQPPATAEPPSPAAYPPPQAAHRVGPPVPTVVAAGVPVEVRVACILTWVFSALTACVYVVVIAAVAIDRAGTIDLARDSAGISDASMSDSEVVGVVLAMSALFLVWCILASVLAALCWRRLAWASVALLVSCGVATLFEVAAVPYSVVHVGASLTALVLLLRPSARAWFRRSGPPAGRLDWPAPSGSPIPPERPQQPTGKPPLW